MADIPSGTYGYSRFNRVGVDADNSTPVYDNELATKEYVDSKTYSGSATNGNVLLTAIANYNFADDGGAVSTIDLGTTIPANAVIVKTWYGVCDAFTSEGSATVSIGVTGTVDAITTSAAFDNSKYSEAWHDGVPTGGAANFVNIGDTAKNVTLTVGTAALTAGDVDIYVQYFID